MTPILISLLTLCVTQAATASAHPTLTLDDSIHLLDGKGQAAPSIESSAVDRVHLMNDALVLPGDALLAEASDRPALAMLAQDTGAAAAEPVPEWNSRIEAGLSGSSGNTQDLTMRVGAVVERKVPTNLLRFDSAVRFSSSYGDRNENNFTAGAFSEWMNPPSKWTYFGQGRYDLDEFKSWDYRLSAAGGIGYRLFDMKGQDAEGKEFTEFEMTLRAGAGVRKEFGSENDDVIPEGLLGFDLAWRIDDRQGLRAASTYFPSFEDFDDYRIVSTIDWNMKISVEKGLSLSLGIVNEYESVVDAGLEHNDFAAFASLVFEF